MEKITVAALIKSDIASVWHAWTSPEAIITWNAASEDWHTPYAQNDLTEGGVFVYRMESKDGREGFDFGGTYTEIVPQERIVYVMGDKREVSVTFEKIDEATTRIQESFDPETQNSLELQRAGWQAILDNFKRYVERSV